eukprot:11188232-Lingulodinium_polyedra.AAC.2
MHLRQMVRSRQFSVPHEEHHHEAGEGAAPPPCAGRLRRRAGDAMFPHCGMPKSMQRGKLRPFLRRGLRPRAAGPGATTA